MSSSKLSAPEIKGALAHLRSLLEFNDNKRPWGFLLTVSLAVGLPVVIATWLGDFSAGVLASMGGLSSVYLRQTPLSHRLITMGLVTFGFCASFVISLVAGFSTWGDRKSTRLNSSHVRISYAVSCSKKKTVATWTASQFLDEDGDGIIDWPSYAGLSLERSDVLRYGENPHQQAALYVDKAALMCTAQ